MPEAQAGAILGYLRHLTGTHSTRALTDAQLLQRFAVHCEEPAFAALMQRHGRLVWGIPVSPPVFKTSRGHVCPVSRLGHVTFRPFVHRGTSITSLQKNSDAITATR